MSGVTQTFLTRITDVKTNDVEGVGKLRWEGNKVYKWCKLLNTTATVAGAAGDPVAYTAEDGYSDSEVCLDLSDADSNFALPAGTVQATITGTSGTAYYCWVQLKGADTLNTALGGSAADGDALALAATDKTVTKRANADDNIFGYAMDASAKTVVLDCPF